MVRLSLWTIALMVLLRLAIGWHFLFEGYQKIRSHEIGSTETNKPWTAEGYFRVAEGPARDVLVNQFGDPDQETLDRLRLGGEKEQGEASPARTPAPMALEWNDYLNRFLSFYKFIGEDDRQKARERVESVKGEYVKWLASGTKTIKRTPPTGGPAAEVTISIPDRIAEYDFRIRELRDVFDRRLTALGRDVEKRVPQMRGDLAAMRKEFQDDIAEYTTKVKNTLAEFLKSRFSGFGSKSGDKDIDDKLLRMLKPRKTEVKFGEEQEAMPPSLGDQWDAFFAFAKEFNPKFNEADATRRLDESKRRYVRYLLDRDEFSDRPAATAEVTRRLKEYEDAAAKLAEMEKSEKTLPPEKRSELNATRELVKQLRDLFLADVQRHTDSMKSLVGDGLPTDIGRGYAPDEKKKTWLQRSDQITMWVIAVSGGCLLIGLFTRLACITAAGFLILTYLAHPAFPWLPASPMNEGNYVFINKNIIEALALLMLATTRSGQWLGLDAWIAGLFRRRRPASGVA